MAREPDASRELARQLLGAFLQLPLRIRIVLVVLVLVIAAAIYFSSRRPVDEPSPETSQPGTSDNVPPPAAAFPPGSRDVSFCVWNMENLFDDREDQRRHPDDEYDRWFAEQPSTRMLKYQHLTEALLSMNGGLGPDIIVGNEAESMRSAELLKESLNGSLSANAVRYDQVAMKELSNAGRHIAPFVLSRLSLRNVRLRGHRQRILEVHVVHNGHDLTLIASHWTSQLSDDGTRTQGGRHGYASTIAEIYAHAIEADPRVDFLVCGDFNDTPESESVQQTLHMVNDYRLVTPDARPPKLFGLLSGKPAAEFGTIYYKQPLIYDDIGISPGMFDAQGWGYDPQSVRVPTQGLLQPGTTGRHPWRFGSPKDPHARGTSDHLPVVVTLKVAP
jgi:endonuclease/exonuclease/phosphatase family metal-dependent hydrolase